MRSFRKLLLIALPAAFVAAIVMALLVEVWVRWSWDTTRGTPGFLVSHPTRGQRLGINYAGWFAGVPVTTNALGFRSTRDDRVPKNPNTFRILVLVIPSPSATARSTTIRHCSSRNCSSGDPMSIGRSGTLESPVTTPARNCRTCTKSARRFNPTW